MGAFRFTSRRWAVAIGVLAANAGLVRAFFVQEMFSGVILILFALQVGLWRLLRSGGRARRFWQGFEVAGAASVVVLFLCEEVFPDSMMNRLLGQYYVENAFDFVFSYLHPSIDDLVMEHQDGFLVVAYFLPELAVAVLGGLLAASFFRPRPSSGAGS